MSLLSKFKRLFKRAVKEESFAKEHPFYAKATFQKPIDNAEIIKDVSNKKVNKTIVKKETMQLAGSLTSSSNYGIRGK